MTFLERYNAGETAEVYADIAALGEKALQEPYLADVTAVLTETFTRVRYNLEIIVAELSAMSYVFYDHEKGLGLCKPLSNCHILIQELQKRVEKHGYVPLSLQFFYQIVGSCDLTWDYDKVADSIWTFADALDIIALDDLLNMYSTEDWNEMMDEYKEEDEENFIAFIELAPDYYHKDDVSGSSPYCIEITPKPSVDSRWLDDDVETTFIGYLRQAFQKCGFSKIDWVEHENNYTDFFQKVLPQLKPI